jgi:hypothetical protein
MTKVPVDYRVETGVPVPVEVASKSIPIGNLDVGESILFPKARRAYVQTKASRLKKSDGMEFTVRVVDDKHCRVWRKA